MHGPDDTDAGPWDGLIHWWPSASSGNGVACGIDGWMLLAQNPSSYMWMEGQQERVTCPGCRAHLDSIN